MSERKRRAAGKASEPPRYVPVFEADHGGFTVGLDGAGPFPSRAFALAVASREVRNATS